MTAVTAADRELLDPILGGQVMRDLMARDHGTWEQAGDLITRAFTAGKQAADGIRLTPAQARYLSILAAQDLRADGQRGWTEGTSNVIRDIHEPAWEALQPACEWEDDPSPNPPAILTAYHDDGTTCNHGFLQAVQAGPELPWCAGGQQLARLQITPSQAEDPA